MNTRISIERDKKGIKWIRATPVNLVVSLYPKEIRIWTCERGENIGSNIFRLVLKKDKYNRWKIIEKQVTTRESE